eukprot:jgi/Bigna1/80500/fgenesh1_pg.71_\
MRTIHLRRGHGLDVSSFSPWKSSLSLPSSLSHHAVVNHLERVLGGGETTDSIEEQERRERERVLIVPPECFTDVSLLGGGHFSQTYKAFLPLHDKPTGKSGDNEKPRGKPETQEEAAIEKNVRNCKVVDGITVVIKMVPRISTNYIHQWEELEAMAALKPHRNVVDFIGVVKWKVGGGGRNSGRRRTTTTTRRRRSRGGEKKSGEIQEGVMVGRSGPRRNSIEEEEEEEEEEEGKEESDRLCIVTRFCELGSLDQLYHRYEMCEQKRFLEISEDICRGLAHLHEADMIHRDLGCRNCFMEKDGNVVVGDYGQTRVIRRSSSSAILEESKQTSGSSSHLHWSAAPEYFASGKCSQKSDIWMFGVTLLEIYRASYDDTWFT